MSRMPRTEIGKFKHADISFRFVDAMLETESCSSTASQRSRCERSAGGTPSTCHAGLDRGRRQVEPAPRQTLGLPQLGRGLSFACRPLGPTTGVAASSPGSEPGGSASEIPRPRLPKHARPRSERLLGPSWGVLCCCGLLRCFCVLVLWLQRHEVRTVPGTRMLTMALAPDQAGLVLAGSRRSQQRVRSPESAQLAPALRVFSCRPSSPYAPHARSL